MISRHVSVKESVFMCTYKDELKKKKLRKSNKRSLVERFLARKLNEMQRAVHTVSITKQPEKQPVCL